MDERSTVHKAQSADFKTADQRADFWKVRIVPQSANHTKVYLFPSLLDWLSERPQYVLGAALIKKETELGIELPDDLIANAQKVCVSANIYGDPLTAFVGGFCDRKPSSQDLAAHLQRSYSEMYQRSEHCRSRELVSIIDACLLLNQVPLAMKLSEDNNYEHDLLQLSQSQTNPDVWDDYKTSVMLRLSRGGVPSPETFEAATVTRLMCDFMAGPPARRRAAIAEMAASGLKLDAMVLARLYFPDDEIFNQLQSECAGLFEETMNFDTNEIAEEIIASTKPFFQRHFLRSADQLSCYRILRIDYALNEHAPLEKKLVGRLELARHVRYVIADALAYRNFEAIALLTEDAVMHLDKYCFFTELEQIVYITAMNLLSEAARMIFHAKPASVGWKKEKDEGDRLGLTLQQHPNGYIGGLIELWTKRDSLMEIVNSRDVYRQHSLLTSIEAIATVLREDTLLNPICRGLLIFACEFVCSALQALFGRPCQRINELAKTNTCLDHHTGSVLVRRLMKKVFSSKIDENASRVLNQLCDMPIEDALVASKDGDHESRTEVHHGERVVPIKISSVTSSPKAVRAAAKEPKTSPYKCHSEAEDAPQENNTTASCPNSDLIDTSSVAPSRSVCEQVATMMEGVKYCRERESTRVAAPDRGKAKRELAEPSAPSYGASTKSPVKHSDVKPENPVEGEREARFGEGLLQRGGRNTSGGREVGAKVQARQEEQDTSEANECAQIISDDHLDFSSSAQNPSVKTKWLPSDDARTTSDRISSPKKAVDEKPKYDEFTSAREEKKKERDGLNERSADSTAVKEDEAKDTCQVKPDAGREGDGKKAQIVGKGKTMIQKLLAENDTATTRPRSGSERENVPQVDSQRTRKPSDIADENAENPFRATREKVFCINTDESAGDTTDEDIAAVFSRPRTNKDEHHGRFGQWNASSDHVQSGEPERQLSVQERVVPMEKTCDYVPDEAALSQDSEACDVDAADDDWARDAVKNVRRTPDACFGSESETPVGGDDVWEDRGSATQEDGDPKLRKEEDSDSGKEHTRESFYDADEKFFDASQNNECDGRPESVRRDQGPSPEMAEITKAKEKIPEKPERLVQSRNEDVVEPERSVQAPNEKVVDRPERPAERPSQAPKRFLSGGFGGKESSGFGSFGSEKKENISAFGTIEFFNPDRGDRSGGGYRNEQRGGSGGRGGGNRGGFDRDATRSRDDRDGFRGGRDSRDGYRDRERDSRGGYSDRSDGFRAGGRSGYNGGGGRDSRGGDGRSVGYRGGRN
ncbi:hypothetical protein Q1695_004421 [Nippostrongylus brasiliensis]|nr:hypothetical protein Q1695_004421 [Nippostrongylus brasiliensis]